MPIRNALMQQDFFCYPPEVICVLELLFLTPGEVLGTSGKPVPRLFLVMAALSREHHLQPSLSLSLSIPLSTSGAILQRPDRLLEFALFNNHRPRSRRAQE